MLPHPPVPGPSRRPRPRPRLAAAMALLLCGLTACGGGASSADSESDVTLRVGSTGWKEEEALLKFAGLDDTPYTVRWSLFQGGDKQLEALHAGALDAATSSEIPPVLAAAHGDPGFKVAAVQRGNTLNQEVVAPKGSTVGSVRELKGKTVGYVKNTTAHYFLYRLLRQAGLGWDDITAKPLEPDDGMAALNGGAIDAFASYGNSVIAAHQQGARTVGSGEDILSGNFLWTATDDTLAGKAQREALADLIARIDKAYAYVRNGHEKEYAKVTARATHQPESEALRELREGERQRPTEVRPVDVRAVASQQRVADAFRQLGVLRSPLKVSSFWSERLNSPLRKELRS